MPNFRDEAICIRHWDFSETSQTVSLLTRRHGVLRGIAKGAKREKGAFSGGIELLTRGEVIALTKPSANLATITAWDLEETYPVLRSSLEAHNVGMYLADLVGHLVHEGDPHEALFENLLEQLRSLCQGAAMGRVLAFQWIALHEAGYRPVIDTDVLTGEPLRDADVVSFSPRLGGFVNDTSSEHPGPLWKVRKETLVMLRHVASDNGESAAPGAGADPERAARLLAAYIREILGRDLATLRGVFGADLSLRKPPGG